MTFHPELRRGKPLKRLCQKNLKRRIDDDWRQESGSVKLPPFSKSGGSVELEIVT